MTFNFLDNLIERYPNLKECKNSIEVAFEDIKRTFHNGGKLLLCGNGGSAADSDHISGELLKSFQRKRALPLEKKAILGDELYNNLQNGLPAIPLANFTSLVSAYCNDCDPEYVFAQLTWVLGKEVDTLLCISTSGNSANIVRAAEVARAKGMCVIGLTGEGTNKLKQLSNVCIGVPEKQTFKIQELHLPIYHCLCSMLEAEFFA